MGGYGSNGNFGGSGGVIVFDGGFSIRAQQIRTSGGISVNTKLNIGGCGNGAAGTLFYKNLSKLIVDNDYKLTDKKTILTALSI